MLVMLAHFFVIREVLRLKKQPGLTGPQTCLLVDTVLPRTGSLTDRAIAMVGYRRARNATARCAHSRCRRRYCERLFRQYEAWHARCWDWVPASLPTGSSGDTFVPGS
ncbi:MAG: hypothetical protein OXC13_05745 [Caldilineaceae bacterium]|nr:hypothetical protein [Caldilineaceae bacterium]